MASGSKVGGSRLEGSGSRAWGLAFRVRGRVTSDS